MGSATLDLLELHRAVRKLQAASRSNRLDALQDILREIATAAGAFGCAMWEIAPGADLQAWQGRLFLVGAWFEKKDVHPHYLLRIENSFTGAAIREEAPKFTVRLEDEPLSPDSAKHPLVSHGVESALSVPIELYHSKTKASVNLYWSETIHLEERQKQELSLLCSLVPDLYGALVDRVGLNLIKCADQILSRKEYSAKTSSKQRDRAVQLGLEEFVKAVSEVFDSVETSIFLESRGDQNQFALRATDWRWTKPVHKKVYGKGEGITGYVLATEEPVRILDLGRYNEEREAIRKQYDGLEWKDPLDIRRTARETLGLKEGDELPPLSHMSVPVMNEGRLLGAIRCSCRRKPPYFFDDRQVQVLELAAATLGSWWENWMERWETEREAEDWRDVMEKIASLNGYVHAQLNQHIPDERAIFRETMKFLANLIPETVANDVRLIDRQQKRLEIVETDGSLWDKGNYEDQRQRRQKVFPLDGNSAAAHVVVTRKAYVVEDTTQAHRYDATFDEVRTVALAPLVCGKEVYGTLGVRRGVDRKFSQHERVVLELIANQLGLYHFLADEITELSKTKQQLQSTVEAQRRMYEDFQHQVRSPIVSASRTIQEIVKNIPRQQESLAKRLSAVQGLCAQAERVARNLELFVALALEKQIQVRAKGLSSRVLLPLLVNSARDHQAVMPAYRNIRFAVDEDSVTVVDRFPCSADLRLLEQAINNVLDNAGKYSYPNTVVWISVGLMDQSTMLFISTTNMGHPIRGDEVKKVLDRGYRSESAISSTAEGHGIGLWIVQKILEAHKGRVTITPTSPQGVTDVRLVLPKAKVG